MTALFQTPRCERCELSGEVPLAWACVVRKTLAERGYCYSAVCEDLDVAQAFMSYRRTLSEDPTNFSGAVMRVYLLRPERITWEPDVGKLDFLVGKNVVDAVVLRGESVRAQFSGNYHVFVLEEA